VQLFLHTPLPGTSSTSTSSSISDSNSNSSSSSNNSEGGKESSGRLLSRLVGTVHQEIEGLLTRKGNSREGGREGGVRLRRMLARESFALLTLLSANNPEGLSAGLSGSRCRWTLEAVNFRLMNRLVEGLEDLTEEAENLHYSIQ